MILKYIFKILFICSLRVVSELTKKIRILLFFIIFSLTLTGCSFFIEQEEKEASSVTKVEEKKTEKNKEKENKVTQKTEVSQNSSLVNNFEALIANTVNATDVVLEETRDYIDKLNKEKKETKTTEETTQERVEEATDNNQAVKGRLPDEQMFGWINGLWDESEYGEIEFLGIKWDVQPMFDEGCSPAVLFGKISSYEGKNPNDFIPEYREITNAIAKEYGEPLYQQNPVITNFEDFTDKVSIKVYEGEDFYMVYTVSNETKENSIVHTMLYISQLYTHDMDSSYFSMIEAMEDWFSRIGKPLKIKYYYYDALGNKQINDIKTSSSPEDYEDLMIMVRPMKPVENTETKDQVKYED